MILLQESLKANPTALQYCIQYEVLQKKPIFESYRTFCKSVGPDVMDFQEFEFWYWRFYRDQLDLDYDRCQDSTPLSLSKLPVDLIEKVVEKLDPVDRISARHVSKPLRHCVDRQRLNIQHARIQFSPDSWALVPSNNKFVVYEKSKNGCVVKFNNLSTQRVEIRTDNFMKVAMNDIMMSLNKPNNPLKHLEIDVNGVRIDEFIEGLSDISDEFSSQFYVKSLFSKCSTESIPLLRIVKPGVLERIQLVYLGDFAAFNTIVGTQQWKQAKVAQFTGLIGLPSTQLEKFYHFDDFTVLLMDFDIRAFADLMKSSFSKLASGSFVKNEVVSLLPINFVQMTGHQQILADTRENITYHLRASFGAHFVRIEPV